MKKIVSDKLNAKFNKCLFIGYPKETIGYYFYHPLEQKVFVSKHAVFLEKEFLLKEDSGSKFELDEVQDDQIDINQSIDNVPISHNNELMRKPNSTPNLRRSSRTHIPTKRYSYLLTENNDVLVIENVTHLNIDTYQKYLDDNDAAVCIMFNELQKQHEDMDASSIITHLKELFDEEKRMERYEISKSLFRCKMI